MEDENIFLRAALSKSIEIPTVQFKKPELTIESRPSCSYSKTDDMKRGEPPSKARRMSTESKPRGSKIRSTEVEKVLVGEGFRKYGMDSKATVHFMIKHREILDDDLKSYYESVGKPGGLTMNSAIDRIRRLQKKKLEKASRESSPKNEKTLACEEYCSEDESELSGHDAWEEAAETTKKKDTRFVKPILQDSLSREDVVAAINNDCDTTESTEKTGMQKKDTGKRRHKQNTKAKMDNILASLPELIKNANKAARDHSECLKKMMGETSDD